MAKKTAKKGGRKKLEDPKEPLTIWIEKSIIKALGGKDMTRTIAKSGVRSYHKQIGLGNHDE